MAGLNELIKATSRSAPVPLLTYSLGASPSLERAGAALPSPSSRQRALLAARRAMVDNQPVGLGGAGDVWIVDRSPRVEHSDPALRLRDKAARAQELAIARRASMAMERGQFGAFSPTPGGPRLGVVTYPAGNYSTRRHEVMHGYTEAARRGYPGMPLSSRLAARLPNALGLPLDEASAMVAGGVRLRDIPWGHYAGVYASAGERGAARVAQALDAAQRAGRYAAEHPALIAGAGVGGAALMYGLSTEDEQSRRNELIDRLGPGGAQ